MKYDVFISYSTFDEAIARDVCRVLEEDGICCWIALRDAKPGNPYACEIMSGIEESKMLLLIFSSNSNVSEPVASEIEEAFNKKKPIIVFLIENKPMAPELKFFLKRKHWLVAYPDYKQKLGNLVHATHDILGISKPKVVVVNEENVVKEPVGEDGENGDRTSNNFWDFFASSTFKVGFRYIAILLIVVFVGVGAWSSFIVQTSKQPDTEREQYVKDSLMAEFERKEKARIAEQHRLEKERLAKENAEKVRIAEQQSLERERFKQASSQREQYVKDSLMAEFKRKEERIAAENKRKQTETKREEKSYTIASGSVNGYEYVDLGLSVKWATCNVGANSPEEFGYYLAWGETKPKEEYRGGNSVTWKKEFDDISGNVQYDAARANWGAHWRLPNKDEFQELMDNCEWEQMTLGRVIGYKVTSKKNGKSIFLPNANCRYGTVLYHGTSYMTSTPFPKEENMMCYYLSFYTGFFDKELGSPYIHVWHRSYGVSVRPVCD